MAALTPAPSRSTLSIDPPLWLIIGGPVAALAAGAPVWITLLATTPRDNWLAQQNWLLITLATAAGLLVILPLLWLVPSLRQPTSPSNAGLTSCVIGLWIFVMWSLGGLAAVSPLTNSQWFAMREVNIRVLLAAAVVATYAAGVLLLRRTWILVPIAQLALSAGSPVQDWGRPDYVRLVNVGFFVKDRTAARRNWLRAIETAMQRDQLEFEATRAIADAGDLASLATHRDALAAILEEGKAEEKAAALKQHARIIAITRCDDQTSRSIGLMKVQNQLFVLALLLLAAVGVFGILGWVVPMTLGAVAAMFVRIRDLTPVGGVKSTDGGARWMALLLTPLVGALSAVLGLTLMAGLAAAKILDPGLAETLTVAGLAPSDTLPPFGPLAFGVAIAFGWSAKLLDDMLAKLTGTLNAEKKDTEQQVPGPAGTPPAQSGNDPALR